MNPIDHFNNQPHPSPQPAMPQPPAGFGDISTPSIGTPPTIGTPPPETTTPPIPSSLSEPLKPMPPVEPSTHSFNDEQSSKDTTLDPITFGADAGLIGGASPVDPVPVVRVLSTRGVEYGMMTITLWIAAASLAGGMISIISGNVSFSILAFPISLLLVTVPVFAFFFLRLKKAEVANPSLRLEPSKRRWSQTTQFLAFLTLLINTIVFVYLIMSVFGDNSKVSWGKAIGNMLVILVVAGGILAYYWIDEHRLTK